MTISIKHAFVSAKGDGGDATLVRPSNWNAEHATSMATSRLIGRLTAGVGAFEEIAITALVANALNSASGSAFLAALGLGGFETGDVKFTFATVAPAGWLLLTGGTGTPPSTIGNASSAALLRANADCLALFTVIYNACADAEAPVSGGRTGNAVNDFNANKTIRIPNIVGRSPMGAGSATDAPPSGGAATTAKTIGRGYGAETAVLTTANLPPYTPAGSVTVAGSTIFYRMGTGGTSAQVVDGIEVSSINGVNQTRTFPPPAASFAGTAQGGTSSPVDKVHSSIALNVMVKL